MTRRAVVLPLLALVTLSALWSCTRSPGGRGSASAGEDSPCEANPVTQIRVSYDYTTQMVVIDPALAPVAAGDSVDWIAANVGCAVVFPPTGGPCVTFPSGNFAYPGNGGAPTHPARGIVNGGLDECEQCNYTVYVTVWTPDSIKYVERAVAIIIVD